MKVPGSDAAEIKVNRSADGRTGEQAAVRRAVVNENTDETAGQKQLAQPKADSIKVSSLGALLQSELNPAKMAEERAQKIAALKEAVQNGTYAPDSQAVAQSVSEELYLEIALAGDVKD